MDEKTSSTGVSAVTPATGQSTTSDKSSSAQSIVPSTEKAATEHRKAYGTAKTENLRDSGLWRIILPVFVILLCLGLLAIPLIILIPLLYNSLGAQTTATGQPISLTWLWITMIIIEVGIAVVIIWGLIRIFMTPAGNYRG